MKTGGVSLFNKRLSLIFLIIIISVILPTNVCAENQNPLFNILPGSKDFKWTYKGLAEYGHEMIIENKLSENDQTIYKIKGKVYNLKDSKDYPFELSYTITDESLIQDKKEENMMDSKFDKLILLKLPLKEGNTWQQKVLNPSEKNTTLKSTIIDITSVNNKNVYTVKYEDINSKYYEIRKIKENIGVIYFEKNIQNNNNYYNVNYSLDKKNSGYTTLKEFTDLKSNSWYSEYVSKLIKLDVISGYPDNTFRPNQDISVAEFIKLMVNSLGFQEKSSKLNWYDNYILKAKKLNLITDGFYNYERPILRKEATKILLTALNVDGLKGKTEFKDDSKISQKFKPLIKKAVELKIIKGYTDKTFKPNNTISRAEASKIISIFLKRRNEYAISKTNWNTYTNKRFDYEIKYPSTWNIKNKFEDGITFYDNKNIKIKTFVGENNITNKNNLNEDTLILDTKEQAKLIWGIIKNKVHFNMIFEKNNKKYNFVSEIPYYYFLQNKSILSNIMKSFEAPINGFNKIKALKLEQEFKSIVLQDTDSNQKVINYNNKMNLINKLSKVMKKDLAKKYINNYFKENDNNLYLIPKDSPTWLIENKKIYIKQLNEKNYKAIQYNKNSLIGDYELVINYKLINDKWIIENREVNLFKQKSYENITKNDLANTIDIEKLKKHSGYKVFRENNIIFIGLGKRNTSGYSINITSVKEVDSTLKIKTTENTPKKDTLVSQVVTYPYTLIRLNNIPKNIQIMLDGNKLKKL